MKNKFIFVLGACILICMLVVSIVLVQNARHTGNKDRAGGDEVSLRPVTLMLDWTPNVNHVGIFVAHEQGYFADEGLVVDIIQPGEVYPAAAVLSGRVEFGIDYQEYATLLSASTGGGSGDTGTDATPGIVSIAAMLQSNTSGFATRGGDGIENIADFASLTYGTFSAPFEEPTLRALLQCSGVDDGDIAFVPAGNDLLAMLSQKRADLVWIFYGTQGFQAEELGIDIDYFPMHSHTDCIPDYYTPIIIASEEYLEAHPDSARAFLRALDNAYQFIVKEPQKAAAILARAVPELNEDELQKSVPWVTQYMLNTEERWGVQRLSVWLEYAQWMHEAGLLADKPTRSHMEQLFSNAYLPR